MAGLTPPFAKITRPVPGENLPRTRLFRLIDQRGKRVPLLWICGPPGCGKTTLVSTYIEARKIPALWYRFDEGDDDLASFFYYLGVAGKRVAPRMRKPLPLMTPEYMPGIQEFTRHFFENLFSRLSPGRALVFDDYQEVPTKSHLHDVIVTGLSRAPEGTTVFIVSRRGPPSAFARFRVNNRMEIIGRDDLRLSLAECREIARLRGKKRQSSKEIRHLHETTDGWAAGFVLMLESSRSRVVEHPTLTHRTPRELFDYFGSEIFGRVGKSVREFLLKTAFLPDMTAKAAITLTGQRRAPQLLSYLSGNNLFLTEHFHSEPLYRYHPLFREFLLSRSRETLGEKETHALKQRAAALLEEADRIEDAADLFSDIGDHESLARLILAHASSFLAQGRNRMLEGWLERLPEKTVHDNPWLLFWLGACRMPFDPVGSRSHTEGAFEQFWERKDPAGTFLSWSLIIDNLCMYLSDFQALDKWIDIFDEIRKRFPFFPSPEIEARAVASMLGGLYMRRVDHPDIEAWVDKASAMIREVKDTPVRLQASLYVFLYFIWIGDFSRARGIVESTRQWISSSTSYPQRRILFHLFEARLHCGVAQFDDSIKSVAKGLEIARSSGMHIWDFFFLAEGTSASLGKGDLDSASEYLRKMSPVLNTDQAFNKSYYYHLSSWHASLEGDMSLAISRSDTANELETDCGAPCAIALGNLHAARLKKETGKVEEAENHLEKASRIARGMRSPLLDFQCSLVEADIALLRGDEPSGLAALKKALGIGREHGYFHYDNWIPSIMVRLCVKALKEGIEVPYVQELVRKRKLVPHPPPLDVENWPWPVRIYTLGRFEIMRDGKPLTFSRKVQKRPLSLLKALVAFGGRGVREEPLADAVWPEAEGDAAAQSFSVNVSRLRHLLGHDGVVQRREGLVSLDPRYCWVDAFAFEQVHGEAASLWEGGQMRKSVEIAERAAGLYRGPFLAGDARHSWTVAMRERIRSKYLRTVGRLGAHWQREERWDKARECYEKGIEVDNLAEEFYQGLMICYLERGRKAEAIAVYDRLMKTLAPLGVAPSPKTRNLLESLLPV